MNNTTTDAPETKAAIDAIEKRAPSNPLLAGARAILVVVFTFFMVIPFVIQAKLARDPRRRYEVATHWTQRWAKMLLKVCGIRHRIVGPMPPAGAFLTPNHISFGDIAAIAASLPTFFVSKIEAADLPFFGWLIRLTGTPLVRRSRSRGALSRTYADVIDRLEKRQSVVVFLEGTTTAGDRILRFQRPLIEAAVKANAPIVPMAVCWQVTRPGLSVARDIAFFRLTSMFGLLWRLLGLRGIGVEIRFGEPIAVEGLDRKQLAELAREQVVELFGLTGKNPGELEDYRTYLIETGQSSS